MMFPNESSWGGVYSVIGSIFLLIGVYFTIIRPLIAKRGPRLLAVLGCGLLLFGVFTLSDYIGVKYSHQVPRFRYEVAYDSTYPDQLVYKTLFFTVVRENPGTEQEEVYIRK